MVSYLGDTLSAGLGSSVDGGALADGHIVTDLDIGHFSIEFEILRDGSDHGAGEDFAVGSHLDVWVDDCMWMYLGVVADLDVVIDEGVRSDLYVFAQLCIGAYSSKRMNFCHVIAC